MKHALKYLFAFVLVFIGLNTVKASTYYTNSSGVNFTEEQYDYITEMYYDGYQELMSQADLDKMVNLGLIGNSIYKYTMEDDGIITDERVNTRSTSIYYAGRTLTISKSCTSDCLISLKAQWGGTPSVKSWDVIGFRTSNMTGVDPNLAAVVGTGYSATYFSTSTQFQQFSNGFGYSVKLGDANNLKITTSMYSDAGGTAYGSYQHAGVSVSLAASKQYTISVGGYGSVFLFYGDAYGKYDGAPGVYTAVS